jgi:toxin HigB-1
MGVTASRRPFEGDRAAMSRLPFITLCVIIRIVQHTAISPLAILSFAGDGTEDVFDGSDSRAARRACPNTLWTVARRKLDLLNAATQLTDLRFPPGNRLEALKGDRAGQHSIRVNDQYRICFRWTDQGAEDVEIDDYH